MSKPSFPLNENIQRLISESLAIEAEEAQKAGTLGFMSRSLVQATMPHKDPGNIEAWGRENGQFSMIMQPGVYLKDGHIQRIGLPYGSIPRLLLAWITTEAVRTKDPRLMLGNNLTIFMRQLGLIPTGGRWGTITRLREQMRRLLSTSISCYYEAYPSGNESEKNKISTRTGCNITKSYNLWWDPKKPTQKDLWDSELILSQDFFQEIIHSPIPIDMRVLKTIKKSPMALDIYCWITHRMSYLNKHVEIPWCALKMQFGSSYQENAQGTRDFKKAFLRELKKVNYLYPKANVQEGHFGLVLKPSLTHVVFE